MTATAPTAPSKTAALMVAAAAAVISAAASAKISTASAARSLDQLDETTSRTAVPERFGDEISRINTSRVRANAEARRSTSPQSAGYVKTRPHQRRSTVRIRHHLQELISSSTAPAPLSHRHRRNTAMDTRSRQVTGLHCLHQLAMHRCHHLPDPMDHLHRRVPRGPTGALHQGIPRPSRHILSRQACFREVRFRVIIL